MTIVRTDGSTQRKPLRLWPGVAAVVLQWLAWYVLPIVVPEATVVGWLGAALGGLVVVLWWAFFSRARWFERVGAIVLMILAVAATPRLLHESIATAGQGVMFFIYVIPVLSLAFVAWAVVSRRLANGPRRAAMVATILLACGGWTLLRSDGITGDSALQLAWRWTETPEQRLLAGADDEPKPHPSAPAAPETGAEWPGLRGPDRNGVIRGVRIETDWSQSPPVELWRRPIGPGISSFAVHGDRLYTQEQRGDDEVVACYDATTGEPVWRHRDAARFWDSHAGAGPHGTPTLSDGRVYTFGATGNLNALDTGNPRWSGPAGGFGHSSPHLMTIDGVRQILLLSETGATSFAPADGTVLWEHRWPGSSYVQPALTAAGNVLIAAAGDAGGIGIRRLAVAHEPGGWVVEERWTSAGLKPYFNDFVVHDGHAYGFDGRILSCIDLEDGQRKWKGGRYGHGQLVLLADQGLLLVMSEKGDLALVGAAPDSFTELAQFPAIEGKTWNHPVLVGDLLLVRNAEEMAAFRLSLAGG